MFIVRQLPEAITIHISHEELLQLKKELQEGAPLVFTLMDMILDAAKACQHE